MVNVIGKIMATSGYIGDSSNGWQIGANSIYNGVTSMSDTSHHGTYVGIDGIKFRQSPTDPSPSAETRISRLGIDCDTNISAGGFSGKFASSGISTGINGRCAAHLYDVYENGNEYVGATGQISWASGSTGYSINVLNGIVVGIAHT